MRLARLAIKNPEQARYIQSLAVKAPCQYRAKATIRQAKKRSGSSSHMPFPKSILSGFLPATFSGGASGGGGDRLSVATGPTEAVGLASGAPPLVWDGDCFQDFLDDFCMTDAIASYFRNDTVAENCWSQLLDVLRFDEGATSQEDSR